MPSAEIMVLPATVFDALVTNAANTTGGILAATGVVAGITGTIANTTNITQASGVTLAAGGLDLITSPVDANVVEWLGTPPEAPSTAGVPKVDVARVNGVTVTGSGTPDVNVISISGDTTAADNLEAACDGTGYNVGAGSVVAASVTGAVGSVTGNVGGNVAGSVASIATGGITAASFEASAINATAIAANAITDAKVASDVTIASVTGSVGSVAAGGITSASFAEDAIDANAIAADMVTEVQSGLATTASITALDGKINTIDGIVDNILLDTNELQTDWANGGRLDLLLDSALAAAVLARQILGNKHTVVESPAGTFTISVRNDADDATVRTIVYIPATGARTVS